MRNWLFIVMHHSATKDSGTVSWDAIRRYHKEVKGWRDIGYHFGIEWVEDEKGGRYEIYKGRPLSMDGAHTKQQSMNKLGVGVCCVGDYDKRKPPEEMLIYLIDNLILDLMEMFDIPEERIRGHHYYASHKSCPGELFDMDSFRELVSERKKIREQEELDLQG